MTAPVATVALLGTESTGKTSLAQALAGALIGRGQLAVVVPEWLRTWCDREGRTPRPDEQADIARTQAQHVAQAVDALSQTAPSGPAWVIADTTPLMTALYSDWLFADTSLYPIALAHQRGYSHTLVTGLDLPWVADGLQRDGPHVREPIDALLRAQLVRGGISFKVVYGEGDDRLRNALSAIGMAVGAASPSSHAAKPGAAQPAWVWACDKCSDPDCEHCLFSRLTGG